MIYTNSLLECNLVIVASRLYMNTVYFQWHSLYLLKQVYPWTNEAFFMLLLVCVWLQVIDKSFGFDTAVEEAQRAINAAHVEVESVENGVGIVKLMGRYSGKQ